MFPPSCGSFFRVRPFIFAYYSDEIIYQTAKQLFSLSMFYCRVCLEQQVCQVRLVKKAKWV